MMNATSSSDRHDAARKVLQRFDKIGTADDPDAELMESAHLMAHILHTLIEPPATKETPEQIADTAFKLSHIASGGLRFHHSSTYMIEHDTLKRMMVEAVQAGIQAAWESWEPENSPAPAFKPEGEPDEYRDMWRRIDDNSQEFTLDIHSHHHEVTITELTRGQARRILEMLSSEASA
jgi:hypothetical protein